MGAAVAERVAQLALAPERPTQVRMRLTNALVREEAPWTWRPALVQPA